MGTRADFYIGRDEDMEWLGSIAWDGYPSGIAEHLLRVDKAENFRAAVERFLVSREDGTKPEAGWPWPWDDSATTDYAYAFDDGAVWYSIGYPTARWWKASDGDAPDEDSEGYQEKMSALQVCRFPDMSARKKVTMGKRSGLIVLG